MVRRFHRLNHGRVTRRQHPTLVLPNKRVGIQHVTNSMLTEHHRVIALIESGDGRITVKPHAEPAYRRLVHVIAGAIP